MTQLPLLYVPAATRELALMYDVPNWHQRDSAAVD
jgi:hypothetical protein